MGPSVIEKVRDRVLWNSVLIMTMLTVAILLLMTMKLALASSIISDSCSHYSRIYFIKDCDKPGFC
ncbi:hypothetical protein [Bacillus sp. UNC438CL73TsuS30]|uniref:hypothetical protein n=1 Tax=Bacillus sp. UNC438CL73TsuS30 TaxID=1340434 RepID=UPI00047A7ED7|nr:hypothetical protein [Bacillus sp. UNC438CL73TsuS30]